MAEFHVGTSGWSYKDWAGGVFYTGEVKQPLSTFFERFDILHNRLGPVLVQLPPSLGFHQERTEHFFQLLQPHCDYRFALEVRHETWLGQEARELRELVEG